ncbi:creatininase family protein [Cohnella silvisoli]|uniref:Creatininase family protein n=1 Tax=Cohnella silvisoli TaxID=2873699 RepID=A0ABV1L1N4_9BACL|nr:creatininase family protein [Cohnella silvisoli]MCD9025304.1 creatininase family protein [Cohnella silvisoli]
MRLQEQSWVDIGGMDKTGIVIVVPLGALEQHGHHLPLGVDSYLIQALAELVEKSLPDQVMLLPTVWVGHSPHHMKFPGTVSVSQNVYADLLEQIVSSLVTAGYTKFLFLNGHGGNALPVQMALQALKNRFRDHRSLLICGLSYWNLARKEMQEIRDSALGGMGHACEMETSMMMHLYPDYVDETNRKKDGRQPPIESLAIDMLHSSPVSVVYDFDELTETGTFGDPTLATKEKGKQFMEAIVRNLNGFISDIAVK